MPFEPADMDPLAEESPPRSPSRLYSPAQIAGGTFLGGPIAGAILFAMNAHELGEEPLVGRALKTGVWATLAFVGVSFAIALLEGRSGASVGFQIFVGILVGVALAAGAMELANRLQGAAFDAHLKRGGSQRSTFGVFGIGFACGTGLRIVLEAAALVVLKLLR